MSHRASLRTTVTALVLGLLASSLAACGSSASAQGDKLKTLSIDWATYNPLSLVVKDKGYLESALKSQGVSVKWVQDTGSSTANDALRSDSIQVGSVAGSASLLARANGSPIKAIVVANQPEWSALVVPKGSSITSVADLKGKSIAAAEGTDPYFFLVQALQQAGLSIDDVKIQNLAHADGLSALTNGSVDAWAGLDPMMAQAEQGGDKLLYRNVAFNTYDLVDAREDLIKAHPDVVQAVVDAYEKARAWAKQNPDQLAQLLATAGQVDPAVAKTVIEQRTNVDIDPVPGAAQQKVLTAIAPTLVKLGDVATQDSVDSALNSLLDPQFEKSVKAAG